MPIMYLFFDFHLNNLSSYRGMLPDSYVIFFIQKYSSKKANCSLKLPLAFLHRHLGLFAIRLHAPEIYNITKRKTDEGGFLGMAIK